MSLLPIHNVVELLLDEHNLKSPHVTQILLLQNSDLCCRGAKLVSTAVSRIDKVYIDYDDMVCIDQCLHLLLTRCTFQL